MSAKGNPKFCCPSTSFYSNDYSKDRSFDSVNVNTELPKNFSFHSKEEDFDFLHFYGEMDDYEFHKMMSVDDLTYSTLFSDEVFENGEWHTYAGLETCNVIKSARHGNELLGKSIQSATERGDSGIRNLAYLSGDDTKLGTDYTKADVYESSNSMLVGDSIREDQNDTDIDLDDNFFSLVREEENDSDSDNGGYFLADESLERTLDASFKSIPCMTGVATQTLSVKELDPDTVLSSKVLNSEGKEDDDLKFCVFDEMPMDVLKMMSVFLTLLVLFPLLMMLNILRMFLGDILLLKTYFLQSYMMIVMMQTLFGLF